MYVNKNFSWIRILQFSGVHILYIGLWATAVTLLFFFFHLEWFSIPWLPISVIGTAVAFYIGFKNNQSYDRLWEARKIWGGLVNSSRIWGTNIRAYVTDHFSDQEYSQKELSNIHQRLLYRHIAYLYTLRSQLLIPTQWEHIRQSGYQGRSAEKRMKEWGVGLYDDDFTKEELSKFLPENEIGRLIMHKNTATQIIDCQSQELKTLHKQKLIDDFRHMELQKILNDFYIHQGQAERIKKFPLPRQYASISLIFVWLFILLLPLGMVSEFHKLGHWAIWLSIPFTMIIGWVFIMMELVGDYSENPFEGLGNDIPMLSLCRIIEIDLREMLGETDLPPSIEAKNGVLM